MKAIFSDISLISTLFSFTNYRSWAKTVYCAQEHWENSEAQGQKRKTSPLPVQAKQTENSQGLETSFGNITAGLLYEAPRPWSIACYEAPWTLKLWGNSPLPPFLGGPYYAYNNQSLFKYILAYLSKELCFNIIMKK